MSKPPPPTNPRGRPPLVRGERSQSISVRVPVAEYNRASARSRRDRVSLPTVVRRALKRHLDDDDDDE